MQSNSSAQLRYDSLVNHQSLEQLIIEGESEDIFYECKAPAQPVVNKDLKNNLAKMVSGFSNTEGGVLIYGIETQKHKTTSDDVMVQVTPLGSINGFAKRISNLIPTLTVPAVTKFQYKIIKNKAKDTKGVLVIYIPSSLRPVQSVADKMFWFRAGDQFVEASYTIIERLFSATDVPDVGAFIDHHKVVDEKIKKHNISIILHNESAAAARDMSIAVTIKNPEDTTSLSSDNLNDNSSINKEKVYTKTLEGVLHRGLSKQVADLNVVMKGRKRKLTIYIEIFADKMSAREYKIDCYFSLKTCKISKPKKLD